MGSTSICVLGSANMDLVALVDRAPALGETVTGRSFVQMPGGKGSNQALAAARAGADVRMIGAVGDDVFGAAIRNMLKENGVETAGLVSVAEPTGTAHIVVDAGGGNSIVVVPGANATVAQLSESQRAVIRDCDTLLMQLELPLEVVVEAAAWARACGTRVVLTPAPVVPLSNELLATVDLLVPNEHEAALLTGVSDPTGAAQALLDDGVTAVVVTLGERGCLYLDADGATSQPAPSVTAVDTTAAGDTFVGCLAVALGEGRNLSDALGWATSAAVLSVQRVGASASMPYRAEIDAC
ncbi:MAG: ribokinase [Propionibacteriales bacterium]|nr:ribokinase [Propionibacteriales bacterium]